MFRLLLLSLVLVGVHSAFAAPTAFKGYCMVVETGTPPGAEINLPKGDSREISRQGDISFQVKYADVLDEKNVLQLIVTNEKTQKQSMTDVFVDTEFPRRIDLVSELGSLSCSRD